MFNQIFDGESFSSGPAPSDNGATIMDFEVKNFKFIFRKRVPKPMQISLSKKLRDSLKNAFLFVPGIFKNVFLTKTSLLPKKTSFFLTKTSVFLTKTSLLPKKTNVLLKEIVL